MQSEEFDNKIREAADHHHPAYDENAWARMEKLLNKHLPQENDGRKRIIFFLLLFLLLGGGSVWLFSNKPWSGKKQVAAAKTPVQKSTGELSTPLSSNTVNVNEEKNKLNKEEMAGTGVPGNGKITTAVSNKKIETDQPVLSFNNNPDLTAKNTTWKKLDKSQVDGAPTITILDALIADQKNNKKDPVADKDLITATNSKPVMNDPAAKENTTKENKLLVQHSPEKKVKDRNKKTNSFFFTLSAGPDISASGSDQLGKTKLLAGLGLGYTFKDRLTIRSGFYSGRKIYTSSPASYHPPASFWNYYPNLEKVDADCRVYEIPLSLSYQFGHSSKQNWFVSTGVSSYLMKEETYNYYYKYMAAGPTIQRKWTIQDVNKHYFSILTLSGGYQRNIGNSFSIMVEPYFKLPLSGVGFGKVKLNSGGVLFSVGIKPFAHSKKPGNTQH